MTTDGHADLAAACFDFDAAEHLLGELLELLDMADQVDQARIDAASLKWAEAVWAEADRMVHPGLLALGGRPGDVALLGDLLDPGEGRRRVVEELLEAHGARRDGDVWAITTDQADALLAAMSSASRDESRSGGER